MYYTYILYSSKSKNFYFGYTEDIRKRFEEHNNGLSKSTAPYRPWKLVFYGAFNTMKKAKDFELYLKTGSGKAFAYKRLLNSEALKKDKLLG
jgi:putative endonuclease